MKKVAIIQARTDSTRLPGKVLKKLCGKTVLEHVINRVKTCSLLDEVVVATTTLPEDDIITAEAEMCAVKWYRGSKEDLLARYYEASRKFEAHIVIRITSDCPLFDPVILEKMLQRFNQAHKEGKKADYLSNCLKRTFPRGLDAEIFTFDALENAYFKANLPYEREHVTPYIYQHPENFHLKSFENDDDLSFYRWTLDCVEDFKFINEIYKALYKEGMIFLMDEIIDFLKINPSLMDINVHVEQKNLGQ